MAPRFSCLFFTSGTPAAEAQDPFPWGLSPWLYNLDHIWQSFLNKSLKFYLLSVLELTKTYEWGHRRNSEFLATSFAPCCILKQTSPPLPFLFFFKPGISLVIKYLLWIRSSSEFLKQCGILQLWIILTLNGCLQCKYLGSNFLCSTKSDATCSSIFHIPNFLNIPFNYHPSYTFSILLGFDIFS